MRLVAMALLVLGVLALVYGGFSYSSETHEAKIGPLDISVTEKKQVNIPIWAGVALVAAGAGLLPFAAPASVFEERCCSSWAIREPRSV